METVRIDEVETFRSAASVRRRLTDPLGAEGIAVNYYELEPEESLSGALHTHLDQEELFCVLSGRVVFETDEGDVPVGAGEAIRFAPGEYQQGRNRSDDRAVVLAIGAPADRELGAVRVACDECGARATPDIDVRGDGEVYVFDCAECGAELFRHTR